MESWEFCTQVLKHVPRATREERREIRRELNDHLLDGAHALEEKGCDLHTSMEKAVERMGDPVEIGEALNAQLSPFWLWLGRGCTLLAGLICVLTLSNGKGLGRLGKNLTARWFPGALLTQLEGMHSALAEVEYKGEKLYYLFPVGELEDAGYTQYQNCDVRLEVEDQVFRVFRIYRNSTPGDERVGVAVVEYSKDPHGYCSDLINWLCLYSQRGEGYDSRPAPAFPGRYVERDSGEPLSENNKERYVDVLVEAGGKTWGISQVPKGENGAWPSKGCGSHSTGGSIQTLVNIPVEPGDTYIKLVYKRDGAYQELEIPLPWEVME